ncbi:DUF1456 family protein [Flavobacteriaceae bacterium F08102]|nr:DUF1456 family protein [Flavobacteriaceae bacterium F08102]
MNNNDIIRRLRYTFDIDDDGMIKLFSLADTVVSRTRISEWLKKDEDENFREITDKELATFLNGLIIKHRGKKEGEELVNEDRLDNNMIFRKLKIALNLKSDEIVDLYSNIGKKISPHELSSFFRNPKQKQYRYCNDQYLRQFLSGLQYTYRGERKG